jgi:flagella basal body P-ring formation protein FlgA
MSKLIRTLTAAVVLTTALCLAAHAADGPFEITLKQTALVSRDVIELGDIAELAEGTPPDVAHLVLGNSPWPGYARKVSRVLVKVRLVSAGLDLTRFAFRGADECRVELKCVRVEPDQILTAARGYLEAQFPSQARAARIELLQSVAPVLLPEGKGNIEFLPSPSDAAAPPGTVQVDVDIVRDGARLKTVPVAFSVKAYQDVAEAAGPVGPGHSFTDVPFVRREVTPAGGAYMGSPAGLRGKTAASTMQAGQTLTRRMVGQPNGPYVIEMNQQVFLVVQTETLRVVTVGKALSRARQGGPARARNVSTGREVVGVAVGNSTIQVFLEGQTYAE